MGGKVTIHSVLFQYFANVCNILRLRREIRKFVAEKYFDVDKI
jgi:hypothetical protein